MKEGKSKIEFEKCIKIVRSKCVYYDQVIGFTKYGEKELSGFDCREGRLIAINDENFSFAHFRVGCGRITIGGVLYSDKFYYGLSICCPEDNFDKKIGRLNVRSRLLKFNPNIPLQGSLAGIMLIQDIDNPPVLILKKALLQYIERHKYVLPRWVVKSNIE